MNIRTLPLLFSALSFVLLLCGCGRAADASAVHELSFPLEGIKSVTISYDDEDIRFFQGEDDCLLIREYMTKDKERYHANVVRKNDSIKISEGEKPFFKGGFVRYIEVWLPASYHEGLMVTTTDGDIEMSDLSLRLDTLQIDCTSGILSLSDASASVIRLSSTSGEMDLGNITGDQIRIETTQGAVTCQQIAGKVTYTSTSGDARFLSAKGSGSYTASNSGKLSVVYEEVTGNLSLYNKNEDVELVLPADLPFYFEAAFKNGSCNTSFQESLTVNGSTAAASVGDSPSVTVKVESKNGNIKVTQ